ncbi:MAG TPA: type II secretion system protein GspM, partial [Pseudomonadota bacterium]|nr:type II secretion system protein GspM [Pseudomonadota bacterium]
MIARWRQMAARDRLVLGLGAGLVALMFGWAFVWYPLAQGQASLAAKLGTAEADLAFMRQSAAGLRAARASGATGVFDRGGQSLLALTDRSAREAGLGAALRRVEPLQDVR